MADPANPLMRFLDIVDDRNLGFGDAVIVSGINARQLRNGLDRGSLRVGEKLPSVGRWVFSVRECLTLMVVGELTTGAWTPPSVAHEIGEQISSHLTDWAPAILDAMWAVKAGNENHVIDEFIVTNREGGPEIMRHRRGDGWGFFSLDGTRLDLSNFQEVHIRIPLAGLIHRLVAGVSEAMVEKVGADWATKAEAE